MAYDSTMIDEADLGLSLSGVEYWCFAVSSRYDWSQDPTLVAAYELRRNTFDPFQN
jgi:hypothetical protein